MDGETNGKTDGSSDRNPLDIPEILYRVFGYMDPWDLKIIRQIPNRRWHAMSTLMLSEKLTVTLDGEEEDRLNEWILQMKEYYQGSEGVAKIQLLNLKISKLNFQKHLFSVPYAPFAEYLHRLELTGLNRNDCYAFLVTFPEVLKHLAHLSLGLDTYSKVRAEVQSEINGDSRSKDGAVVGSAKSLRSFSLSVARGAWFTFWPIVFDTCPALEDLSIYKDDDDDEETNSFLQTCKSSYSGQRIRKLNVVIMRSAYSQSVLVLPSVVIDTMALIETFPLVELSICISGMEMDAWTQLFCKSPESLKKLMITVHFDPTDTLNSPSFFTTPSVPINNFFAFMEDIPNLESLCLIWKGNLDIYFSGKWVLPTNTVFFGLKKLVVSLENPGRGDGEPLGVMFCKEIGNMFPNLTVVELYEVIKTSAELRHLLHSLSFLQLTRLAISKDDSNDNDYIKDEDLFGVIQFEGSRGCHHLGIRALASLKELLIDANCDNLSEIGATFGFLDHPSLKMVQFSNRIPTQFSRSFVAIFTQLLHVKVGGWQ